MNFVNYGACGLTKLLRAVTEFLRHLTKLLIQTANLGQIDPHLILQDAIRRDLA